MKTWYPGGPNSAKNGGSLALTQASMILVPSIVEVCCQPGPAGGTAKSPYLPGARFLMVSRPSGPVTSGLVAGGMAGCVGRAEQVAESVLALDTGRRAVAATAVLKNDLKAAHIGLAGAETGLLGGQIGCIVDRCVVMEEQGRDWRGRDRVLVDIDDNVGITVL